MSAVSNRPIVHLLKGREGRLRIMRFWSKVDMRGPDDCWEWQASLNTSGYGRFKLASYVDITAARLALIISTKSEPQGMLALHSCDNPPCCNPHHLRWGTVQDNSDDMKARGRSYNGEQQGFSNSGCKLTPEQFAQIIEGFRAGLNNKQIANGLPVDHSLVSRIRRGRSWAKQAAELGWSPQAKYQHLKGSAA